MNESNHPSTTGLETRIRELEEQVEHYRLQIRRLEAREALTGILAEAPSIGEAVPQVLEAVAGFFNSPVACFWIPDAAVSKLRCTGVWAAPGYSAFAAASTDRTMAMGVGLPGRVWLSEEPVSIPDLDLDDNFSRTTPAVQAGLRSALAFPILAGTELTGVIEVFSASMGDLDTNLSSFLPAGQQIGSFIQKRRAERQLARQARISGLRADIGTSLARTGDLKAILTHCTDAVVQHLGAAFARIWTLNAAENVLELQASSGLYTHIDGGHRRVPVGAFKIGWIAEKRKPHLTNSVQDDPRVTDHEWARREGMQAFAGYPLVIEDQLTGVLALFSRRVMEQYELDELAPIADAVAQFLFRRRAAEDLRRNQALKLSILDTALDAIIAMDETGKIAEFNTAAEKLFGYTREQVIGRKLADMIVPPRLRDAHRMGLARYLSTGESHILGRRIEISAVRAGGAEFPVELTVARIAGDGPAMFTAYIREIQPRAT